MAGYQLAVLIFVELLVLLFLARLGGEIAERLGYGPSVGEITIGIAIAATISQFGSTWPSLVGIADSDVLTYAANGGIFFLVLMAGIEMEPDELSRRSGSSVAVALGGMLLPLVLGFALASAFLPDSPLKQAQAMLVGVALSISAIPATVKVFRDFGLLHSAVGETVVTSAVIDDVLGIILLAVLTAIIEQGEIPDLIALAWLLVKVGLFFVVTLGLGAKVYPVVSRGVKVLEAASHEISTLILVSLGYCLLAEYLGMHWIIGAFMAGLYFERSRVGRRAYLEMKLMVTALAAGLLGPLFFVSIGLRVDLGVVIDIPLFLFLLVAIAFLGKVIGCVLPAYLSGLGTRQSMAVGVGMSARGAMELIILSIAQGTGLLAAMDGPDPIVANLFSALVLMAAGTTMLMPILLRPIVKGLGPNSHAPDPN